MVVEVGGVPVAVQDVGAGPPLVLVHCGAASHREWGELAAQVRGHRRVLAPDLFAHGDTPAWPGDRSFLLRHDAQLVGAVLGEAGGQPDAVGHSYGAASTAWWALHHPGAVRRLVLVEPTLFGILDPATEAGRACAAWIAPMIDAIHEARWTDAADGFFEALLGPGGWRMMPAVRKARAIAQMEVSLGPATLAQTTPQVREAPWEQLAVPTTVVVGTASPPAFRAVAEELTRRLPDATIREIQDAGHMAPLTHGPALAAILAEALA